MLEKKIRGSFSIILIFTIMVNILSIYSSLAFANIAITEDQIITVKDGDFDENFGFSVSLSGDGNIALIGAPFHDGNDARINTGAAYFFQENKNSDWKKLEKIESTDPRIQLYGGSVTLSSDGSTALIGNILYSSINEIKVPLKHIPKLTRDSDGLYYRDTTGTSTYVYKKDSSDKFFEITNLIPNSRVIELDSNFGSTLSLSNNGTIVLIGAHSSNIVGPNSGIVSVFEINSNYDWIETAKLSPTESITNSHFGYSTSISADGTTALIGSFTDRTGIDNGGTAYLFQKDQNNWIETAKLSPTESAQVHSFGYSVDISEDGTKAIIGAPSRNSAYIFDLKLDDYLDSISNIDMISNFYNPTKVEPPKNEFSSNSDHSQTKDLQLLSEDVIIVPEWIKNNAKWWSQNKIDDNSFISGIQFLIKKGTMKIPETVISEKTSDEIPGWVKNNAGWWSEGLITNNDFLKGIQYLIENGVVKIDEN